MLLSSLFNRRRGRDCNDFFKDVYPGRSASTYPSDEDHNCNGIKGTDSDGVSFEKKFCEGTGQRGVIVLGDSAAAHFHIPPEWMRAADIRVSSFEHILFVLENEFDWPQVI